MDNGIISLFRVSYIYPGEITALKNISFEINKGESVAFLGANGSGKSTLMMLLAGLIFPQEGNYSAFGRLITKELMERQSTFVSSFRKNVGVVFQNPDIQLFCPTVSDEIAFAPLNAKMSREEVASHVEDTLSLCALEKLKKRAVFSLSGGEKKKVAIASVLSVNPQVLLIDEPFAGLDNCSQKWLVDLLINLKKAGKTIIMATHNLACLDAVAERIIVINESHTIEAEGASKEIISSIFPSPPSF